MTLYDYLYVVCLFGTVISGTVSVVLFIRLDMKTALRVLGKRETRKKMKAVKRSRKKRVLESHADKDRHRTVLLHQGSEEFRVVREILLVHTDETI